jgi:hemerythrin-like domain-containing protein
MKDQIEMLRSQLPVIKSTLDADYFHDQIDQILKDKEDQLEMVENSLKVLKNDIAVYAIRFADFLGSKEN